MLKYIRVWFGFSFISFFLYDIIWLLIDYEKTIYIFKGNIYILFVDLLFCMLFSAISLISGCSAMKYLEIVRKQRFTFTLGLIMVFANMILTFVIEAISPDIIIDILTEGENVWTSSYIFGLITPLLSLVYITDMYYNRLLAKNEENARLQMNILKMQLNPHFVFNSLSVLVELIETAPRMAIKFVIRLSRIYRYFIRAIDKEWISIADALSLAKDYMALMKVRSSNVTLVIEKFPFSSNEEIVILSLLVLLENAIKHNLVNNENPLIVYIKRSSGYLCIENNISPLTQEHKLQLTSMHVGLSNLTRRTKLLCGKDVLIYKKDKSFEVRIPIVNKESKK